MHIIDKKPAKCFLIQLKMISLNKIVLLVTLLLSSFGFDFVFSTNLDPNEMMMPKMGEQKQQEASGGSRGEWLPSRNEGGEFRLKIGARDEFCFHEYFDLKETSNIKYNIIIRVLKGGRSKDIDINVYTPKSTHIIKVITPAELTFFHRSKP